MNKYRVYAITEWSIEVEAKDMEDAYQKAYAIDQKNWSNDSENGMRFQEVEPLGV